MRPARHCRLGRLLLCALALLQGCAARSMHQAAQADEIVGGSGRRRALEARGRFGDSRICVMHAGPLAAGTAQVMVADFQDGQEQRWAARGGGEDRTQPLGVCCCTAGAGARRSRPPAAMQLLPGPSPPALRRYLAVTTDDGQRVVVVADDDSVIDLVRSGLHVRVTGDWQARPGNSGFGQQQGQGQGTDTAPGGAALTKCMSAKACMRARAVTLSSGRALGRSEPTCEPPAAGRQCCCGRGRPGAGRGRACEFPAAHA